MATGALEADDEEVRARGGSLGLYPPAALTWPCIRLQDVDGDDIKIEEFDVPLREWIALTKVERQITKRFGAFLNKFGEAQGDRVYPRRINDMCSDNRQSLEVSYLHLSQFEPILAIWVADAPAQVLPIFHDALRTEVFKRFPNYGAIHEQVFVRVTDLPISDAIRDIRQSHLNALIRISGVVTRRTGVFPQLNTAYYNCLRCGQVLGPIVQNAESELKMDHCSHCGGKGPFTLNQELTHYRNYQKMTLQESPGSVPAGRLPRSKEIILLHDLIDCARPGEEVEVTGIYTNNFDLSLNTSGGFPVFATVVEANYVARLGGGGGSTHISDEDRTTILQLSHDPRVARRIVASIAPSIHGHEDIKLALALALFGGQEKHVKGKARLRGDINVLLLGDPGTAKSQFLKYVEKTAHRAVYTTGKGASAVGLTASVHKDPVTREWTLEGGALVLADRGVCLIDEFDKMNDSDRVSIHEAMEQQSISISKAGIVTSLQARCSVCAAANPVGGRYDSTRTFSENVELTDPILSRFDILLVVKDTVDPVLDERLANFVVGSHIKSHPDVTDEQKNRIDEGVRRMCFGCLNIERALTRATLAPLRTQRWA
jgi:DNA replication licensing factor MCM2